MNLSKIFAAAAAALTLFGCAEGQQTVKNTHPLTPSAEPVESAIFGRTVSYDPFTPAENISLPIAQDQITDMLEIRKNLYFLVDDAVYFLNLETAEAGKLLDTPARMFAADGENIYTYDPETGLLSGVDTSGSTIFEHEIPLENDKVDVMEFYATENYFVFICRDRSGEFLTERQEIYDKNTFENVGSFSEKLLGMPEIRAYGQFRDDSLLRVEDSRTDSRYADVFEFSLETGKSKKLAEAHMAPTDILDFSYSPAAGTVIFLSKNEDSAALEISEYSLNDPDNIVQKRFYSDFPAPDSGFVTVHENIVSTVADGCYRFFDSLDPPESIVLACSRSGSLGPVISRFERETGVTVRTVDYGTDTLRLDVKLMAGDTDFDIFIPVYYHQHKYFLSGMFEDLKQYEGLRSRLDGDVAAGYVAELDGKYIGVPTHIGGYFEEGYQPTNAEIARLGYLAENVDVVDGTYNDADGKELYNLLKFLSDGDESAENDPPFGKNLNILSNDFVVMNPNSQNKENAAKFLEYLFDSCNGEGGSYIDITSPEGYRVAWRFFAVDYVQPILDACNAAARPDGSGKQADLKKLAREVAGDVMMRLGE